MDHVISTWMELHTINTTFSVRQLHAGNELKYYSGSSRTGYHTTRTISKHNYLRSFVSTSPHLSTWLLLLQPCTDVVFCIHRHTTPSSIH
ncbi:hypothetical protein JG687_00019064 [Phytophthora cactorum]|uniref:Uncharacterized protein n=1 Tax=Phytophthora cactorum TaxID=29920 RepID=A0A8T1TMG6_9STRA|nr:hypothetical protein JG687_00019064 [Phytophthora cactorum]